MWLRRPFTNLILSELKENDWEILHSSWFCCLFTSNSILLSDSKAKACFRVDELLLKISQWRIPVEAQSWQKFSTGRAALWP